MGRRRRKSKLADRPSQMGSAGRSGKVAFDHHPFMAVPQRSDPILRIAALGGQQAHDLEGIGRRAMKGALLHHDILADREFP